MGDETESKYNGDRPAFTAAFGANSGDYSGQPALLDPPNMDNLEVVDLSKRVSSTNSRCDPKFPIISDFCLRKAAGDPNEYCTPKLDLDKIKQSICTELGDVCPDPIATYVIPDYATETADRQAKMQVAFETVIVNNNDDFWKGSDLFDTYLTDKQDDKVCGITCPIVLPWSSWSCHCEYSSTLEGNVAKPVGMPTCPCNVSERKRVQMCQSGTANGGCNIYDNTAQCDYDFTTGYTSAVNAAQFQRVPVLQDTLNSLFCEPLWGVAADQTVEQIAACTAFKDDLGLQRAFSGANQLANPCTNFNFAGFVHTLTATTEYRVQADTCVGVPAWSDWATTATPCSQTCGGGERTRQRKCMVGTVERADLINQTPDCGCIGDSEETFLCNTQCCVVWHTCDRAALDCTLDGAFTEVYTVNSGLSYDSCANKPDQCGVQNSEAEVRCICFEADGGINRANFNSNGVYPSCNVQDISDNTILRGAYTRVASTPCNFPCCTQWTNWSEWSSCDAQTCHDCSVPFVSPLRQSSRSCGCPSNTDEQNLALCGNLATEREDTCHKAYSCCPEPCWSEWSSCEGCQEVTYSPISSQCLASPEDPKRRERVKDSCCRRNSIGGTNYITLAGEDLCEIPEVPVIGTSSCLDLEDCCKFDNWSEWSVCELPDGRR